MVIEVASDKRFCFSCLELPRTGVDEGSGGVYLTRAKAGGMIITQAERKARLALALTKGVGPVRGRVLMDVFGSAEKVFEAGVEKVREMGRLPSKTADDLHKGPARAEKELKRLDRMGGWAVVLGDDDYPLLLKEIPTPPLALFGLGTLDPMDKQAVAVVGSRQATHYGRKVTDRLSRELAALGITVVSGLAVGIDAAAHQGALNGGGRTIAVLGCGLNVDYPSRNRQLKADIAGSGAVLSEYPLDKGPRAGAFPARNRIIAGLAKGVVVAEGSPRSGSLITVDHALDFGRAVMAVPGPIFDRRREGPHNLIRQGAALVTSGREVAEELWPEADRVKPGQVSLFDEGYLPGPDPAEGLEPDAAKVFTRLEATPLHIDELTRLSGLLPEQIQVTLLDLELMGLVRRLPGQLFVRN